MRPFYMIIWLIAWGVFSSCSFAFTLQDKIQSILPAPMNTFKMGKTTLQEVENKIGKAQLVEGSKNYWEKDGLKYALVLTIKNKKLETLHYTFTSHKPGIKLFENEIKNYKLTTYQSKYLLLKNKSSELIFDPISKTIYSVRLP